MKINFAGLLLTLAIILRAAAYTAMAAEDLREGDHAALRALRDKAAAAISSQDMKALETCFAREFAFTAVNQTILTNRTQVQEFFDRMFHSSDALITSLKTEPKADILTRFIDANTGICYGSSKDTYVMKSGKVVEMNVRWSATVVKEDGEWKVAIAHVGTDFLDNPVLAGVTSFWGKAAAGMAAGGLLIGFVLGRLTSRGKRSPSQPTQSPVA